MSDRLAFFKDFRLGDFVRGPEAIRVDAQAVGTGRTGHGERGVLTNDQNPGCLFVYTVNAHLRMGHFDPTENYRQYQGRKLQFVIELASALTSGTGFTTFGTFTVIDCVPEDESTTMGVINPGASVTIQTKTPFGTDPVVDDYLFLRAQGQTDMCRVISVGGPQTFEVDQVNNIWPDDSEIYRVMFHVPDAAMTQVAEVPGNVAGAEVANVDMPFAFTSARDPVWYLP